MAENSPHAPLNFAVTTLLNASRHDMQAALDKFYQDIQGADVAIFYFSGHGFSASGQSFLVPVDVIDRNPVAGHTRPSSPRCSRWPPKSRPAPPTA